MELENLTVDRAAVEMEADAQRLAGPIALRGLQRVLNILEVPTDEVFSATTPARLRAGHDMDLDTLLADCAWLGLAVLTRCDLALAAQKNHRDASAFQHLLDGERRLRFMTELVLSYICEQRQSTSPGRALANKRHEETRKQRAELVRIISESPELHDRISPEKLATVLLERIPHRLRRGHRHVADLIRAERRRRR